jgi:hypothetical protein
MVVVLVKLLPIALPIKRKMEHFATLGAKRASMELALFAGNTALAVSEMMALSALSLVLMVAESAILYGMKISVTVTIKMLAVRNGASFGTQDAVLGSTMLHAAFARRIALMTWLILESHAQRTPTAVEPVTFCNAVLSKRCLAFSVTLLAKMAM